MNLICNYEIKITTTPDFTKGNTPYKWTVYSINFYTSRITIKAEGWSFTPQNAYSDAYNKMQEIYKYN